MLIIIIIISSDTKLIPLKKLTDFNAKQAIYNYYCKNH